MKKAGIRETQVHLSELLRKLPFVITRYGKEVAVVRKLREIKTSFSFQCPQCGAVGHIKQEELEKKLGI